MTLLLLLLRVGRALTLGVEAVEAEEAVVVVVELMRQLLRLICRHGRCGCSMSS
jgi:hypothetical protein